MRTALERKNINECIIRRVITDSSVEKIKELISTADWNLITQTLNLNSSSNIFIDKFLKIYNEAFPLQKITIKTKNRGGPWIKTEIKKSSRKKQCLYEKILKNKTKKALETYKQYEFLFEKIFKRLKKVYYQYKIQKCENNIKTTWKTIKELIGKPKTFH